MKMENSDLEIWKKWDAIDTFLVITVIILFSLNLTCLIIIYRKLIQKIDAHVCQKCSNKPEPNLLTCAPTRDSLLGITPIIQAEGDSETERDYSDTEEKQDLSKSQTITYTTVHFNNKKQCPDYENIVETPEYVNVDLKDTNGKNKKVKKKVKSVDYSMVAPMPVPFRRPSHPPATSTDSLSS
ncbi:uncharacterized protein LOC143815662 isoform X1 [Ranitomeya variabilis]|uniref:uncharacterized protein LOC143815662 isoform X1 n=1 Tax=Ranitomeya variabilis TaxID=490064 RepID=UPI004056F343